ncbi:MAG: 4Fe-4S dicluster domain-containing protein, partial [Sedimentisphaerales bacterium]|nr:4Fe-4S dicluster domain-containing protein [Sedimentisphaerales bacterium]
MACRVADSSRPFGAEEIERIKKHLAENMNSLCTGCGYCLKGCPQHIPIASYMQFYNQKTMFGKSDNEMMEDIDLQHNWQLLAEREASAADCSECGRCEEACTQHLNIIERLREIARWENL